MRAEGAEFLRDLEDLEKLLHRIILDQDLLRVDPEGLPESVGNLLRRVRVCIEPYALRKAHYSMLVIALYSSFERYVDRIIAKTVECVNDLVPSFDALPDAIRRTHRRRTLEALSDESWLDRQADGEQVARALIERLQMCEAGSHSYRLNSIAYTRHSANYRAESIARSFREIGVEQFTYATANSHPFKAFLEQGGRERGLFDDSMHAINDLAERRNEVAHGAVSDLLSPERMLEYIRFFRALALSYHQLLRAHLGRILVKHHGMRLGRPARVHYHSVVVLNLGSLPRGTLLRRGDAVVALPPTSNEPCRLGRIANVRSTAGDVDSVLSEHDLEVSLQFDFRIRAQRPIFLIKRSAPCEWLSDNSNL